MKTMHTVIFDLDGTLIDHFKLIARSVNHAENALGLQASGFERVKGAVGGGYKLTLERLFGSEQAKQADPLFLDYFNQHLLEDIHVLPGAYWLLETLHKEGRQLAVLTNKGGPQARQLLEHLKMDKWFVKILGAGDTPYRKPQPEFMGSLLEYLDTSAKDCLMIGDSPFDFEAAEAVNMPTCLLSTGSHTKEELSKQTNACVYKDLYALADLYFNLQPSVKEKDPHD